MYTFIAIEYFEVGQTYELGNPEFFISCLMPTIALVSPRTHIPHFLRLVYPSSGIAYSYSSTSYMVHEM